MKTDNPVKLAVEAALRDAQFLRKSDTWYRDTRESVLVVNVQKSNFGEQYYINLGVFVKGLLPVSDKPMPKEHECHIRLRLESLTPGHEDYIRHVLLDIECESLGSLERQRQIHDLIAKVAIPFILQCSTRQGIRDADRQNQLSAAFVHRRARELILS